MSKKQDTFYYDNFIACAEEASRAADLLKKTLEDFHPDQIAGKLQEIHKIEHEADDKKHVLTDRLAKAFITPIDREDIPMLSQNIDEITDKIEEVLIRIYINHIDQIRPEALKTLDVVISCCNETCNLLRELADFRHSKALKKIVIKINTLEEEADQMFINNMYELHEVCKDHPQQIIAWREIYEYLERCADACEHVADTVSSIVMKNS